MNEMVQFDRVPHHSCQLVCNVTSKWSIDWVVEIWKKWLES